MYNYFCVKIIIKDTKFKYTKLKIKRIPLEVYFQYLLELGKINTKSRVSMFYGFPSLPSIVPGAK